MFELNNWCYSKIFFATLSQQLSWSHIVEMIKVEEPIKRDFYINMCTQGRWSVRTLRERMDSMLFERTAISKQPEAMIHNELTALQQNQSITPHLFLKDPYLFDFLDLLFYHRKLRRLVLIELKMGDFKREHKGQVEMYLKWLTKYEQQPSEQSPIAIILCSGKDTELVELMDLEPDNIHIAEYWLTLPPKEVLQAKLHKAMIEAREKLDLRIEGNDK